MIKKNVANIITSTRIISTIIMIFMPVFSMGFFVSYTYAGVSDFADGLVARKFKLTSDFGAKLDSVADLLFYISMMIKILPFLIQHLPSYVMITIYTSAAFRMVPYAYAWFTRRKFISNHTYLNKVTGFMLFIIPYLFPFVVRTSFPVLYAFVACTVAIIAGGYDIKLLIKEGKK